MFIEPDDGREHELRGEYREVWQQGPRREGIQQRGGQARAESDFVCERIGIRHDFHYASQL